MPGDFGCMTGFFTVDSALACRGLSLLRPQLFPNFSKPGPSKLGPYDSEPEIRLAPGDFAGLIFSLYRF